MKSVCFHKGLAPLWVGIGLAGFLFGLAAWVAAQRARPPRPTTGFDDVVFAISFSPDGTTLAIARGAGEPTQRYGRIELWDTGTGLIRHVIKGFDGPIGSVAFSPDGKTLVSGSSEFHSEKVQEQARSRSGSVFGELKWWDAQTGELKNKLTLPTEGNVSVRATYSPDGNQLAVVSSFMQFSFLTFNSPFDVTTPNFSVLPPTPTFRSPVIFTSDLKLLDSQTGTSGTKLKAERPKHAVFSPDGQLLAADNGNEIKLWQVRTQKEERKLRDFKGAPNAMAFSPDGLLFAVAVTKFERRPLERAIKLMARSEVRLYDVRTGKPTRKFPDLGAINSLAFEPGGKFLLMGGVSDERDGNLPSVKLYDLHTGKWATLPAGGDDFNDAVSSLAVSANGSWLAYQSGNATVRLRDTRTWKVKQTMDAKSVGDDDRRPVSRFLLTVNRVTALAFSNDGKTLSGEIEGSGIKLWDPRTGEVKRKLGDKESAASLVAISSNGESVVDVSADETLRVWQADQDKPVVLKLSSGSISALALSTNGKLVAIGGDDELRLWDAGAGENMRTLSGHQATVNALVFSQDDRLLGSADTAGNIKIWDVATGQLKDNFSAGAKVTALRFAPMGQLLASAGDDRSVSLWDLRSDGLRFKLQKHSGTVNALTFSTDGQLLASGSDDRSVIIWEVASGKSKKTLKGHDLTVASLAFSPDGSIIASGSGNASVVLWEVRTGKLNRVLR